MLAITILVAATGLALGLRFNVFVLVPVLLLAITSIFVIGIGSGGNARTIALHLLATLASVQISYLIGCLIAAQFPTRDKTTSSRMQTRYLRRFSTRRGDALTIKKVAEINVRSNALARKCRV